VQITVNSTTQFEQVLGVIPSHPEAVFYSLSDVDRLGSVGIYIRSSETIIFALPPDPNPAVAPAVLLAHFPDALLVSGVSA